ncbi:hypothetical protein AMAG_01646 [Allomyces macrogynus ATCC 38327]|uniref:CCDC92/74 N-terminal domain-containing protein n=1 Tax=Allomyces macrogynus (strain ATCC 38327) TaxID=578462 RepID=A0A0L0S034_ALLM3|nr:hypothetical protein AMAG_01646 [Allomyces macrogynus ATCC 38327]|eukprot:KNE55770.1 hypothetical protein AMAG_01646 [Allomyces macrogynus ATCC 38327]
MIRQRCQVFWLVLPSLATHFQLHQLHAPLHDLPQTYAMMPRSIEADDETARRIQSLERTVEYLRTKHSESLQTLHEEIRGLQARCAALTWKHSLSSLPGDSALSLASADADDPAELALPPSTHTTAPPAQAPALPRAATVGAGAQTDTDVHVVSAAEHARQTAVQTQQNALLHDVLGKLQALTALQAETAAGYAGQVAQSAADFRATVADLHATIAARDRTIAALHSELDAARAAATGLATAPPPAVAAGAPSRSTSKSRMPTVKSILSRIGEFTHAHHAPAAPPEPHEVPRRATRVAVGPVPHSTPRGGSTRGPHRPVGTARPYAATQFGGDWRARPHARAVNAVAVYGGARCAGRVGGDHGGGTGTARDESGRGRSGGRQCGVAEQGHDVAADRVGGGDGNESGQVVSWIERREGGTAEDRTAERRTGPGGLDWEHADGGIQDIKLGSTTAGKVEWLG